MKRFQLILHKYHDAIKTVLLAVVLLVLGAAYISDRTDFENSSKARGEAIIDVTSTIKKESEEQSRQIERQFQALCYLIVETQGREALKELDPPLDEQCRNLASEVTRKEADGRPQVSESQPATPVPVPNQTETNRRPRTDKKPQEPTERPERPPETPERPNPIQALLDDVLGILRRPER